MRMELISFDEDSNVVTLDLDEEAKMMLLELGFNAMMKDNIKKAEVEYERSKTTGV